MAPPSEGKLGLDDLHFDHSKSIQINIQELLGDGAAALQVPEDPTLPVLDSNVALQEGKKSRKFIDRKRDVLHTFKVVPRSQRDPLVADEAAPQAVLLPTGTDGDNPKAEEKKYGIYFDDDYNYLQHLRGVREAVNWDDEDLEVYTIRKEDPQAHKKELRKQKLVLPSSAFESFVEEPIGLLNKAAPITGPHPELDPDVVAGLDDEFTDALDPDDDNALPDNFVAMLNSNKSVEEFDDEDGEWEDCDDDDDDDIWENELAGGMQHLPTLSKLRENNKEEGYDADEEERDFSSDFNDSDDEERDEVCSLNGPPRTFREEETASHFTNYSLTSSVLRRNEGLTVLDDCFEEKFMREYQDEQVGALDGEDIEGFIGEESPLFKQVLENAKKQLKTEPEDERSRIINWIRDMDQRIGDDKEKEQIEVSDSDPGEKWDCETILSTYSTQYNHPRTITDPPRRKKIAVNPRTGVPIEHGVEGLTKKALVLHNNEKGRNEGTAPLDTETLITSMSTISIRPTGESTEERRFRKKALKELRRERRIEKKLNRAAFKDEKKRLEKINMNNRYNKKMSVV